MGAVRGDGLLREDGCGGDVLVPMSYMLLLSVLRWRYTPKQDIFAKIPTPRALFQTLEIYLPPKF